MAWSPSGARHCSSLISKPSHPSQTLCMCIYRIHLFLLSIYLVAGIDRRLDTYRVAANFPIAGWGGENKVADDNRTFLRISLLKKKKKYGSGKFKRNLHNWEKKIISRCDTNRNRLAIVMGFMCKGIRRAYKLYIKKKGIGEFLEVFWYVMFCLICFMSRTR